MHKNRQNCSNLHVRSKESGRLWGTVARGSQKTLWGDGKFLLLEVGTHERVGTLRENWNCITHSEFGFLSAGM